MHTRAGNLAEISAQLGQQQWCRTRRAEGGWQKHAKTIQGNRSTQFDWKHSTGLARIDLQPHRLDISRHPQFASQGFSPNYSRPTSDIWHFYSYSRVLIQQPSNLAAHTHTHTARYVSCSLLLDLPRPAQKPRLGRARLRLQGHGGGPHLAGVPRVPRATWTTTGFVFSRRRGTGV